MTYIALIAAVLIAAADQIIKYLVVLFVKPSGSVSVIDNLFTLEYVENEGVAFGMFSGMRWIFIAMTVLIILIFIYIMFKRKPTSKLFYFSAALVIGGGIGNLIDRFIYGYVIDYISLSFFPPVCNFADYCITVGVVLLAIYVFVGEKKRSKSQEKISDGSDGGVAP